jgi:hypothetical protein
MIQRLMKRIINAFRRFDFENKVDRFKEFGDIKFSIKWQHILMKLSGLSFLNQSKILTSSFFSVLSSSLINLKINQSGLFCNQ